MFIGVYSLFVTIILKIVLSRIIKIKKYWFFITLIIFYFTYFLLNNFLSNNFNIIEGTLYSSIILLSYILFLTLVFNDSPTLYLASIQKLTYNKNLFLEKKFVTDRLRLLTHSKLIDENYNIQVKGKIILKLSTSLSNLFLK